MFCKNCGAQMNDNQKFCPNCGTPVQQAGGGQAQRNNPQANYSSGGQQTYNGYAQGGKPPKKSSARPIIIIIIGVVILAAIVVGIVLGVRSCGSDGGGSGIAGIGKSSKYTDPVDSLMKGIEKQDGKVMLDAFSDGTIELLEEESGYDKDEIADMFEEMFDMSMGEDIKEGAIQVDYEIEDEMDLSESDIEGIQEEFDSEGVDEKIEEGKALEITMIVGIEDITDETYEESMELQVIKIDGKWYIDPTSM